jgi:hypothetical protein
MPESSPPQQISGTFIVLSIEDANQVRMHTTLGHACAPVPLKNGTLILPLSLLDDPFHAQHNAFLSNLRRRSDVWTNEIADGAQYPDEVAACQYDQTWQVGVPVVVNLPAKME